MANGAGFHLLVFGVLCGVYAFKYGCVDVGVQAILKAVPIWYLAFALARGVTERHCGRSCPKAESLGFYATQGLLLSSIGDLFLEQMAIAERLGVPEDLLFVLGLGAFLIAHLLYVVASTAHTEPSDKSHTATVSLLGTYCAAFVSMLWPNLDKPLRLPVAVYAVVLASMVYFATLRHTSHDQPAKKKTAMLGVVGAYVFVSSDSLLAFDMFVSPVPNAKLGVMATYYVAQALIFCSAFGALV